MHKTAIASLCYVVPKLSACAAAAEESASCKLCCWLYSGSTVLCSSIFSSTAKILGIFSCTRHARCSCVLAGIGPKDDEFSNKKFSFVRYQSICAVIPDSSDFEAKARAAGDEALAIERGGMKQQ
jgi:hypothetical protein